MEVLFSDLFLILSWWGILFLIGILFLPVTTSFFHQFLDKGYFFSRLLGILIPAFILFVLATFHIVPFLQVTIILLLLSSAIVATFLVFRNTHNLAIHMQTLKSRIPLFLFEELFFLLALIFWSWIRGFQPDIHGLEKFMDFGFVNSILRADYFPPKDMWFTPLSINYYYFGHYLTAFLTKLSSIPSFITYNLMLATLFACTVTGMFSLGATLFYHLIKQNKHTPKNIFRVLSIGLLAGVLTALGGNLHVLYTFFEPYPNESPVPFWELPFSIATFPNSYWYPNATRFIQNTIHEFPFYSFVVSDLHGHVLDIPFVLLLIALVLQIFLSKKISPFSLVFIGFLLAIMYTTNALDGIIYLFLAILTIVFIQFLKQKPFTLQSFILPLIKNVFILGASYFLFSLPFSLYFKPFVSGFGVLCAPEFLTTIGQLGPFLFEAAHCQRSPFWQLLILHGFFIFWTFVFFVLLFLQKTKNHHVEKKQSLIQKIQSFFNTLPQTDVFILLLIGVSFLLILIPEFVYVKDIYPAHYRANTMFKLAYQAFIILSLVSAYTIGKSFLILKSSHIQWPSKIVLGLLISIGSSGLLLVLLYPYFAINSYYADLKKYKGLDGQQYLQTQLPSDFPAIVWLNENIKGQPVILEAQGDSYTDFARISANTGLPTVLGWTVHEWLWRGTYDIPAPRIAEVQAMYESTDLQQTKTLLQNYNVKYVYIGSLERQKYPNLSEEKFQQLGILIYQNGDTRIYKMY